MSSLKAIVHAIHATAAKTGPLSNLYLHFCRLVAGQLGSYQRAQLLNSLSRVQWPTKSLKAQRVVCGRDTNLLIQPHNGELDFAAILGGRIPHEPEVYSLLEEVASRYDAVIEIGANVGIFTNFFAKKLAKGNAKIYAFEPSRAAFARLIRNLELNQAANVLPFNCAVAASSGVAFFYEPEGHLMNGSLAADFAGRFAENVRRSPVVLLAAAELEKLVEKQQKLLIKIDAEGAEATILRSLKGIICQHHPDLLIEVLPEYEQEIASVWNEMPEAYSIYAITGKGVEKIPRIQSHEHRDCFLTTYRID